MPEQATPQTLTRHVDRTLPWVAGASAIAGVLITALSSLPAHLPGIALDSPALFVVERGGAAIAVVIALTTLLARTLKRELPIGFSPTTGSVTYATTVESAAHSSDAAVARLVAHESEQDSEIADLRDIVARLQLTVDRLMKATTKMSTTAEPKLQNRPEHELR